MSAKPTNRPAPSHRTWQLFRLAVLIALLGCVRQPVDVTPVGQNATNAETREITPSDPAVTERVVGSPNDSSYAKARDEMVDRQLRARDIRDARVLQVMQRVPRHLFVPDSLREMAYSDRPLPIGHDQTISQPYIVALMTQLAGPSPESRVLDIGTGSGYQAAVLAELADEVYSIEILKPLADDAQKRLAELGYKNVEVRCGDGYRGWPERAPFNVIIVAAAPDHVPKPLIDQLAPGGRLVIPVGTRFQSLTVIEKQTDGKVKQRSVAPVVFVPMTGEAQNQQHEN